MSWNKVALWGSWLLAALCSSGCSHDDPVGVYAIVTKVQYEADDPRAASKIRVCGAFSIADSREGSYEPAYTGFMYYTCTAANIDICRIRWHELAAASNRCIAYGQRFDDQTDEPVNNGLVRRTAETTNPDLYPVRGDQIVNPTDHEAAARCDAVQKLASIVDPSPCDYHPPPDPPPQPGLTSASGNDLFHCSAGAYHGQSASAICLSAALAGLLFLRRRREQPS